MKHQKIYERINYKKYVSFFQEGKKQALAILKDKKLVDQLSDLDPTDTNKYVELFAKFIKAGNTIRDIKNLIPFINEAEQKKTSIDVTKFKTLSDFKQAIMKDVNRITKASAKKGITGLKEKIDFLNFGTIEDKFGNLYRGYIPLNYKASKVIASKRVADCEGKWCTAYQKDASYWKKYVKIDKNVFVYFVLENATEQIKDANIKLAAQFSQTGNPMEIWDAQDKNWPFTKYFK